MDRHPPAEEVWDPHSEEVLVRYRLVVVLVRYRLVVELVRYRLVVELVPVPVSV